MGEGRVWETLGNYAYSLKMNHILCEMEQAQDQKTEDMGLDSATNRLCPQQVILFLQESLFSSGK